MSELAGWPVGGHFYLDKLCSTPNKERADRPRVVNDERPSFDDELSHLHSVRPAAAAGYHQRRQRSVQRSRRQHDGLRVR